MHATESRLGQEFEWVLSWGGVGIASCLHALMAKSTSSFLVEGSPLPLALRKLEACKAVVGLKPKGNTVVALILLRQEEHIASRRAACIEHSLTW